MDIETLKASGFLIFECISGSTAYGLNTKGSDVDIKGVYIAPKSDFYGFGVEEQIANKTNDIVYYELKKFMSLVAKNNPNILEMLYTPEQYILKESNIFSSIRKHNYLSKLCHDTFARYALRQIQKARGLKKKIVNPMSEQRLTVLDFCYVTSGQGSEKAISWLENKGFKQENCGLAGLPHFPNVYLLYHSPDTGLRGIIADQNATDVRTSSIPQGIRHLGYLYFNFEAFKAHCSNHKEYWDWANNRNKSRYETNIQHGKNYDSKNMLHVFRLLQTAEDIAQYGKIDFGSYDRDFLLKIKAGDFEYENLIEQAGRKMEHLATLFHKSNLPKSPDLNLIEKVMVLTRDHFYQESVK